MSQKKKCSVSVVTTKLVSTAIGGRMEYSSKVRGKEESVYDKLKLQENSANSRRMLTSTLKTWTLSKKCVTKQQKKRGNISTES